MIHGEFDFEDKSDQSEAAGDELMFWTGQVLYVLVGSILTLVLIDVFLGYTVGDIKVRHRPAMLNIPPSILQFIYKIIIRSMLVFNQLGLE